MKRYDLLDTWDENASGDRLVTYQMEETEDGEYYLASEVDEMLERCRWLVEVMEFHPQYPPTKVLTKPAWYQAKTWPNRRAEYYATLEAARVASGLH